MVSSGSGPAIAPEVPHLRQPRTVVLLIHEFAWRRDGLPTPAGAMTRPTCIRLVRRLRRHGKPRHVLTELPVRKLSCQGHWQQE
jgi:hypothetical protein